MQRAPSTGQSLAATEPAPSPAKPTLLLRREQLDFPCISPSRQWNYLKSALKKSGLAGDITEEGRRLLREMLQRSAEPAPHHVCVSRQSRRSQRRSSSSSPSRGVARNTPSPLSPVRKSAQTTAERHRVKIARRTAQAVERTVQEIVTMRRCIAPDVPSVFVSQAVEDGADDEGPLARDWRSGGEDASGSDSDSIDFGDYDFEELGVQVRDEEFATE